MASDHTCSDFKTAPLSGRQQKRGKLESAPAILAGLSILLNTLQLLSEYSIDELNEIATIALGTSRCVDTYAFRSRRMSSSDVRIYQF